MNWKQNLLILLSAWALFGMAACQKKGSFGSASSNQTLIENAQRYFEEQLSAAAPAPHTGNPRVDAGKSPEWSAAVCMNLSRGVAVVVPVFYQQDLVVSSNIDAGQLWALNQLTKLVIWRDDAGYKSELVTGFPDSADGANRGRFSGILFVETWQGQRLETYKLSGGRVWREEAVPGGVTGHGGSVAADAVQVEVAPVEVCYEITGYNYAADDPDNGEYWVEEGGCSTAYVTDNDGGDVSILAAGGGGVGGPTNTIVPVVVNFTGNNPIGNIKNYLQCFSNYGGSDHTYQVTICVSQPVPGSRTPWVGGSGPSSSSGGNPVNVGHTYLVFSENFSGYSVVRNVGFYPASDVYPWSPSAQGQLDNDAGHDYNISLTITVDNGQFFNMLNYASQGNDPGYLYNLSTNNCTSFSVHALEAGGVTLQTEAGSWPGGGFGYDPGDLGEDIRGMQLSGNMSRSTSYVPKPNQHSCN